MAHPLTRCRATCCPHRAWALKLSLCLAAVAGVPERALSAAAVPDDPRYALVRAAPGAASTLGRPAITVGPGTDLQLLNVDWDGYKAVVGVSAHPVTDGLTALAPAATVAGAAYQVGVYARGDWQLTPSLAATLGLRVDHHSADITQLRPRAALAWNAAAQTRLRLQYRRADHGLGPGARSDEPGLGANPLRRLEPLEAFEVDAEQRFGGDLKLNALLYAWTLRGVGSLALDTIGGLPQVAADQTVETRGLELAVDQRWADSGVRLRCSAALQEAADADGKPLLSAPQLLAKLLLWARLPWAGLQLGYEWLYDDDRIAVDGRTLGAYARSNLTLGSTELAEHLAFSLSVQNLFDARDARLAAAADVPAAVEQDRRSVQVQLAYQF